MQAPTNGHDHQGSRPNLARFMAGSAPDGVKHGIAAIVAEIDHMIAKAAPGEGVTIPPAMLPWLTELLDSPTYVGLELLRVLRGLPPLLRGHGRLTIGAALRRVRAELGRTPTAADFSWGHPVPVLAWAYWGGIEEWERDDAADPERPELP